MNDQVYVGCPKLGHTTLVYTWWHDGYSSYGRRDEYDEYRYGEDVLTHLDGLEVGSKVLYSSLLSLPEIYIQDDQLNMPSFYVHCRKRLVQFTLLYTLTLAKLLLPGYQKNTANQPKPL